MAWKNFRVADTRPESTGATSRHGPLHDHVESSASEVSVVCFPQRHFNSKTRPVHCCAMGKDRRGIRLGAARYDTFFFLRSASEN